MTGLLVAALVGVMHVHHAPSHDSRASFEEVRDAAWEAGLDFLILTDHVPPGEPGPVPGAEHEGLHTNPEGRTLLVLAGAEFGTNEGHVLGYEIRHTVRAEDRPARDVIADIHAQGGFAVVPHPFSHGGWHDWDAPFDGLEVHNNASDFSRLWGPLLPLRLLLYAFAPDAVLRGMWVRPERELERWESLLVSGADGAPRRVVGFSGADAHRNVSLLGWQLDPYVRMFRGVQTVCPGDVLEASALWSALREGRCHVRYAVYESRRAEAREVRFPSGRVELQLDDGRRVLEIRNPDFTGYTSPP